MISTLLAAIYFAAHFCVKLAASASGVLGEARPNSIAPFTAHLIPALSL